MTTPLIDANLAFLDQALGLLATLDARTYASAPVPGLSTAGAHLRHILDHYVAFLDGLPSGAVDYDRRGRDRTVEGDPSAAAAMTREVMSRLRTIPAEREVPLSVRMDCGSGAGLDGSESSVARELQFLVSHTVHHFALMRAALGTSGVSLPDEFGVAPSTLAYRSRSACAP